MTLVKTKHRTTVNQRKVTGSHHRKSGKYLKPYWPYLPIILILGGAFIANDYLPRSFSNSFVTTTNSARIDSIIGSHNSLLIGLMTVSLVLLIVWLAFRHLRIFKKLVLEGEQIVTRNFMLDIVFALFIAGLYIMLR